MQAQDRERIRRQLTRVCIESRPPLHRVIGPDQPWAFSSMLFELRSVGANL